MNEYYLNAFPKNEIEALAMLYVQSQDLTGKTPEEILAVYDSAVAAMQASREATIRSTENYF